MNQIKNISVVAGLQRQLNPAVMLNTVSSFFKKSIRHLVAENSREAMHMAL